MTKPTPPEVFRLKSSDRDSDTWARLKKHLSERRDQLRNELESDQDERATAKLRGRIAELRRLLDLEKDAPILPPG